MSVDRRRNIKRFVVDTNVAMVAQGLAPQADQKCTDACVDALVAITELGVLVLDVGDEIVDEYLNNLGHAGKPGIGRAFAKWARDSRFNQSLVMRVSITPRDDGQWRQYDEFPDRQNLSTFDRSDQKFVAVAVASGANPPILNAVDSGWWRHRAALADAGVFVESMCPGCIPARKA
ncbi:MAG: PIN domain-containing protein [Phycisphaerales bacterium]|nr:PIN domain-containing protein [Phycisphaerales bacterium]